MTTYSASIPEELSLEHESGRADDLVEGAIDCHYDEVSVGALRKHPVEAGFEGGLRHVTHHCQLTQDAQYSSGEVVPSQVPILELPV